MTNIIREPRIYEKIKDFMVEMARPTFNHGKIAVNLSHYLYDTVEDNNYSIVHEPNLHLDGYNTFFPDVVICRDDQIENGDVYDTPEIVFEILSRTTRHIDLGDKFEVYFDHNLPEYWSIDPVKRTVGLYVNRELVQFYDKSFSGFIKSTHLPFIEIEYSNVFRKLKD